MESSGQATWKRVLKCAVSMIYFATVDRLHTLLRARSGQKFVVLYYHSVSPLEREKFARQLDRIAKTHHPLSLSNWQAETSKRSVVITFDDGFQNFKDVALPELQKRQLPCTVFVIVERLGGKFGPFESGEPLMSLESILELPRELVTIGSHTLTHPKLTQLPMKAAIREIVGSRAKLSELLGFDVSLFSFPFGDYNEELIGISRRAGYHRVFTTLPNVADFSDFAVPRVRVDPSDWALEFWLKLNGCYRWLPVAFAFKRVLLSFAALAKPRWRASDQS